MRPRHVVRRLAVALSLVVCTLDASVAADLSIPPRSVPKNFSVQSGPPNCSRWTDDCVNCSRGAKGETAICSNIGFACQPKAIRCLTPETSQNK
ncbi:MULTISPECIES: hypothetical protein [unclassified Bradyrhizobium]|uniref:hypothetical protein n=1 Tax=unclassified Bradyrhizobium TaxID=2631580 RepID=UPI001FEFBA85|nr:MULTISPECIES: hypothetical protein [unclassified Bradyrhizobium]